MTTKSNDPTIKTNDLRTALDALAAQARETEGKVRQIRIEAERTLRLARGTRDVTAAVASVTAASPEPEPPTVPEPRPLTERLEEVLRRGPATVAELVKATGESADAVAAALKKMRAVKCPTRSTRDAPDARLIHNHGTEFEPRWGWVIGDQTPTSELAAAVESMITRRPYTFAELTQATGARRGRLSGVLVGFQRADRPIKNEGGTDRVYRWQMRKRRGAR